MIAPMPFLEDRGCPIRVYGEAKGLTELGHRVDVICYHLGRPVPEAIKIQRIIRIPWYNRIAPGANYHKVYLDTLLLFKTITVNRSNNFDIFHAHLHEGTAIAEILKIFKIKKPIIFDAQGSLTGEMSAHGFLDPSSFMFRFWRKVESKIYEDSGIILASSQHLIEMLSKEFNISKKKIKYIPDGVDTTSFDPERFDREEIRKKYKLKDNNVVVFTGVFSKYQGLNFLIEEVIPYVIKERQDTKFLLVGYPVDEFKKLSQKLGIEDHIVFAGKQRFDEIPKFLVAADIAVTPKFMEMGEANLKIFTYMAMGLPTVSFDYPYNKKILRGSGLTTKLGDAKEFAEAILKLLENPRTRKIMGQKGRVIAQNEYSWVSIARKIVEAYHELI
jgi:glycosyltransferase involved in cell wall biosynthesis